MKFNHVVMWKKENKFLTVLQCWLDHWEWLDSPLYERMSYKDVVVDCLELKSDDKVRKLTT